MGAPALLAAAMILLAPAAFAAEPLSLYAAGSLRSALTEVGAAYEAAFGTPITGEFAASGLLRERIEAGERPDVFASANLARWPPRSSAGRWCCSPATGCAPSPSRYLR
jgi:molybdate transport system substrate-binding protein